jgi:hypothetical protein
MSMYRTMEARLQSKVRFLQSKHRLHPSYARDRLQYKNCHYR